MSNHPRVFERRDGDVVERVEVADVATAGWLVTRIVMTRYGVAVHAINIENFDDLTNTWVRIENSAPISWRWTTMDRTLTGAEAGIVAPPQLFPQRRKSNRWRSTNTSHHASCSPCGGLKGNGPQEES